MNSRVSRHVLPSQSKAAPRKKKSIVRGRGGKPPRGRELLQRCRARRQRQGVASVMLRKPSAAAAGSRAAPDRAAAAASPAKAAQRASRSRSPRPRPASSLKAGSKRGKRRVTFCETVDVREYARQLGGSGGVPSDGSTVALGLGHDWRASTQPLVDAKAGTSLEKLFLPPARRAALLRGAGSKVTKHEMAEHRRELVTIRQNRMVSMMNNQNMFSMPTSLKQAWVRAHRLAAELGRPGAMASAMTTRSKAGAAAKSKARQGLKPKNQRGGKALPIRRTIGKRKAPERAKKSRKRG